MKSTESSAEHELDKINEEVSRCKKCPLWRTRRRTVPGEGSNHPRVMLIGEGPGEKEDLAGRPFVGRAGRLLDELLTSIGLNRESAYVTNIVKCRATTVRSTEGPVFEPRDRRPTDEEIVSCTPYLNRQISVLRPRIISTLGDTATRFILEKYGLRKSNISKVHGRVYSVDRLKIIPMYHPAAALYTAGLRDTLEKDFKKLAGLLEQKTLI